MPFRLTCLGVPELHGDGGDVVRIRTRKHLALLIVLAVEPSARHRRDRLATLLWPGSDTEEARHSLAVALSVLRSVLGGDAFDTARDTIRLLPGRVTTDLHDMAHDDPADPLVCDVAPFLDEFDVPDAPDFQLWKDGHQARLVPMLHAALSRRIEHARRGGNSTRVEACGTQLLRIDPLSEDAVRALIEARAMAGDRIGALRVYDRWRAQLRADLDAVPSAAIEQMANRLRRRGLAHAPGTLLVPVPTEQWQERVFIGRATEFRACYDAWQRVCTRDPRHMLVRGESGIGKTTLVERFITAVALEGASVARVQCYELERELPFGTIGGLVTHLLDLPGASATAPEHLAELGRLVAKVRQRFPTLPAPLPGVGESARILFTEAVMALLAAVAEEQPVVLVVDDIPLADVTSLAVLHLILRRVRELPFMVLLTSSSAIESDTPHGGKFVGHADSIGLEQLVLDPFGEADASTLLDALVGAGDGPGPTLRRAMLAGARGNPMVLELLVADWRRRGDECLALSTGAMTLDAHRPPREAFRYLVEQSLGALDAESRAVAELAAVLGKRLNELSMYTLVDLPVARTMRAMTTLTAQHILRDAGQHLEFANEFMRGQCYVAMAAPLRRMLHALVADRLLARDGANEPIPGLEIAWHLVRANRLAEAIPHLLAGGRESIRRGGPHEADLALSTGLPALTGEARRTAILLLAEALQEMGRWGESLRVLDVADDTFTEAEECCRVVLRTVGRRWLGLYESPTMGEAAAELVEIAMKPIDVDVRVKALAAAPYIISQTRDRASLDALGKALLDVHPLPMDSYQRLHVLLVRAWWADQLRFSDDARLAITEAVRLINVTEAASSVAVRTLIGAGMLDVEDGRYADAVPVLQRAVAMARQIGNDLHVSFAAASLAIVEGRLGNSAQQMSWARLSLASGGARDWGINTLCAAYERSMALCFEGRNDEAVRGLDEIENRFRHTAPWAAQGWKLIRADIAALAGNDRRALTIARKATSGANDTLLLNDFAGPFARWKALVALRDGTARDVLLPLQDQLRVLGQYHAKDRVEIMASIALLESSLGQDAANRWADVHRRLAELPIGVRNLMRRLGTLPKEFEHAARLNRA